MIVEKTCYLICINQYGIAKNTETKFSISTVERVVKEPYHFAYHNVTSKFTPCSMAEKDSTLALLKR